MGEAFGTAALISEYFIGLLAAGPLQGDFLQLLFEFFFGELTALQPITGFDDFFDIELENVSPAKLAFGSLAPSQKNTQPATAFLQSELDFLSDLVVVGDGFFGFAGERHPHRSHVYEDHHRPARKRAS